MRDETGFTLIEMLIAAALVLGVMAVALAMVGEARDAMDREGLGVEAAQRLRAGFDRLARRVGDAGAGPGLAGEPAFVHALPVIQPLAPADEAGAFRALRMIGVPPGGAVGVLADDTPAGASLRLAPPPACPDLPACGFRPASSAVVYDGSGVFDLVGVRGVDPGTGSLTLDPGTRNAYGAGARVAEVEVETVEVVTDADGSGRLVRRAADGAAQPVVDHVVAFEVRLLGLAEPPEAGQATGAPPTYGPAPPEPEVADPRGPWGPGEGCTVGRGEAGALVPRLPLLERRGALVPLAPAMLRDGPWCGAGETVHDADLYRIRRVDLRLRVEAAADRVRGPAGRLFARPGRARTATWVSDLELRASIAPPNLNGR